MTTTTDEILAELESDLVSHGLLAQCLNQAAGTTAIGSEHRLANALKDLLGTEKVEIGYALKTTPEYVEFVAWKGSVDQRVARAVAAVASVDGPDREFGYWLCLRENVDRFEGDDE